MHKFKLRRLGVADDPGHYRPNLQACLEAVLAQSNALADELLESLRRSIYPTSPKTPPLLTAPEALEAVRCLTDQAAHFKRIFCQQLRLAVLAGERGRWDALPTEGADGFQFLDDAQLNANIGFAMAQQEVMRSVEDVLPPVNAMVSHLMGWASVQAHLNPLKPESFVYALWESLRALLPEEGPRLLLMPVAGAKLGVTLRQLYMEVADWMRSLGVEAIPPLVSGTTSPAQRTQLALDKLRLLLSGAPAADSTAPDALGVTDFTSTIPASFGALQDMRLLESMEQRLAARSARPDGARSAERPNGIADKNCLAIRLGEEVVCLMVETLLQDKRLLPAVRAHVVALEPALLRLSQLDRRFFSQPNHPARALLLRLTERSLVFSSEADPGFARFSKAFGNAVRLVCAGPGDADAFARLLRKLERDWARADAQQQHAIQRDARAQEVALQFRQRTAEKDVPELIRVFLQGPWAQVVAQVQSAAEPGTGLAEIRLVDDLVWSVQPHLTQRNRRRLLELVPSMVRTIRQGLEKIDYSEAQIAAFFTSLMELQALGVAGNRSGVPLSSAASPGGASAETEPVWRDALALAAVRNTIGRHPG